MIGIAASLKSKLAASRVECTNSCWNGHTVVKKTETAETNVSKKLKAISFKILSAANGRVAIVKKEWVGTLKPVSTNIEMESQGAIFRMRAELERGDSDA